MALFGSFGAFEDRTSVVFLFRPSAISSTQTATQLSPNARRSTCFQFLNRASDQFTIQQTMRTSQQGHGWELTWCLARENGPRMGLRPIDPTKTESKDDIPHSAGQILLKAAGVVIQSRRTDCPAPRSLRLTQASRDAPLRCHTPASQT